ncbi:MAG: Sir2 family NAD-dependent protein deacetylase, partial [Eubacteriales bacterium]
VTHKALAHLEQQGKVKAVVTQNIDGLHQMAGSKCVYELHGSVHRNYCMNCGKFFGLDAVLEADGVPKCSCGGTIKPDVVLYEEGLDGKTVSGAIAAIQNADLLVVGGTSLTVYPAAGMIDYFRGDKLILINKTVTPFDSRADIVINESLGSVFKEILEGDK